MALWQLGNHLEYSKKSLILPGDSEDTFVQRFFYKYNHPLLPPGLFTNSKGEKYITPTWRRVHPKTELKDIIWEKPKKETIVSETITREFKSSSSNKVYTTKYFPSTKRFSCSCPGAFRSRGNCKHIKSLIKELNLG